MSNLLTLFVLDDEAPIREEIKSIDWSCVQATVIGESANGKDALKKCRQLCPDIVIADIEMPLMNGLEFAEELKKTNTAAQIIFLTSHTNFYYAQKGIQLGVLGYVIKSLCMEQDLFPLIEKAAQNLQTMQDLELRRPNLDRFFLIDQNNHVNLRPEIYMTIRFIQNNYMNKITISDIAEAISISPDYLGKLFKSETGISITHYLNELRMKKAIMLLENTNMRVYEIAQYVGIESYRYFTITFRKITGKSPTDYRRKDKQSEESKNVF